MKIPSIDRALENMEEFRNSLVMFGEMNETLKAIARDISGIRDAVEQGMNIDKSE